MDLVIVALTTAASAIVVGLASPPDALRVPLMLPLAFFTPGYAFTSALYSRREDLAPVERLALSFALSLALLPLIALALNYSPWGVRWEPLLAFLSLLVVLASALGLLHRRLVQARDDRFAPSVRIRFRDATTLGAVLRPAAIATLMAPLAALAVILLVLLAGQRTSGVPHTEFYLLGSDGRPDSLPRTLMVGEDAALTVGIANREGEEKLFSITVSVNGAPVQKVTNVRLAPAQRWQQPVILTPERAGNRQLVQFDLYVEGGVSGAYRALYIWVDVREPLAPAAVELFAQRPSQPAEAPAPASASTSKPAPPPASTPAVTSTPPSQPLVHRVARGENLTYIARLYGLSLEAVIAANPLENPNLIYAQQEIVIPAAGSRGEGE